MMIYERFLEGPAATILERSVSRRREEARGEKRGASDVRISSRESLTFGMRTTGVQVHPGSPMPRRTACVTSVHASAYTHDAHAR